VIERLSSAETSVADLREDALVARIAHRIGPPPAGERWTGDDAAFVRWRSPGLLLTTDALVEGTDFELRWSSGADIGYKAMAANASDVAAMGGRPLHAVIVLALAPDTRVAVVDGVLDGILEAGAEWKIAVVGGDLSRASALSVCVAMVGEPHDDGIVTRDGARVGDAVCVTGALGGAAGGLMALSQGWAESGPPDAAMRRLTRRQLRPHARVTEARALVALRPSAMIDVSDGLAVDLARVLASSRVGCEIDPALVPVDADLVALARARGDGEVDPLATALTGGEDFELLFTIDPDRVATARAVLGPHDCPVSRIGAITDGRRRIGEHDLEIYEERGWDHFRARPDP
jgi:thiamine-monophosphate kinase